MDAQAVVQVNVDEIKKNWPAYLQRVEAGETLVLLKAGKPVAELKPVAPVSGPLRPFGLCVGEFSVPDDFDEPLPETVLGAFEAP